MSFSNRPSIRVVRVCFQTVSEEELRKFGLDPEHVLLAQGTLRPDLIESASALASIGGSAEVIKTHHNDTALVRALRTKGRIIEPLKVTSDDTSSNTSETDDKGGRHRGSVISTPADHSRVLLFAPACRTCTRTKCDCLDWSSDCRRI